MASTALILTLLHSLTLILLLPLSLLLVFFFFFQNLHPHHDPPRKDCRSSEYLEQERRYYKSYSSSSLLYHLFFWLVFYSVLFFLFKTNWDFIECKMKLKKFLYGNKYQTHGIYIFFNFFFLPVTNFLHSTLFLFCIECCRKYRKKGQKILVWEEIYRKSSRD